MGDSQASSEVETSERPASRLKLHGFWDNRSGFRIRDDAVQSKTATLGESRLQLDARVDGDRASFEFIGDLIYDAAFDRVEDDIRFLRLTWPVTDSLDLRIGRQVLTWGVGDLLFINDLFPKDWVAFLSGRDVEYLKAPSDSLRVGWYNDAVNVELVYTPRFAPDRFPTGDRFSYYSPLAGGLAGADDPVRYHAPHDYFDDDEIALRLYRNVGAWEVAAYAYRGYWKSPGGQTLLPPRATFPELSVYGASARGPLGPGILSAELGYYDSREDRGGNDPFVNNDELRTLLGYEFEAGKEFTIGVQHYMEWMQDYGDYRRTLPFFVPARDEFRHLFTVRFTKMLMNQNLMLSLFTFYSPSDADAYLRPTATYKINDAWQIFGGANIFLGRERTTFFGQFEDNSNVYAGARFSF
ncbi:MAG: hypothetical protein GC168_19475 [Candidatus Hydrogenedens sp.]|nr:hypothetical protein [Candidatus Hydrogenedens sp.]